MLCEICGGDFPHSPDGVLKYGRHYLCRTCLNIQTPCQICGKKRARKDVFDICLDCAVAPQAVEAVPTIIPYEGGDVLEHRDVVRTHKSIMEEFTSQKKGICQSCGKRALLYKAGKSNVCGNCRAHSGTCSSCGEESYEMTGSGFDGLYCPKCQVKKLKGKEYNWRHVPRKFFQHGKGDFMLGAENEIQLATVNKAQYLNQIAKSYPRTCAYTMYDGTIDYGTEVVFHPRTLKSYQALEYEGMMNGIKEHRTTGMHVHIERTAFLNKMHLYKFIRFIVRNREFIAAVAERDPDNNYNKSWKFTKELDAISKVKGYDVDPDKYMDVNMLHRLTVELRIFKGATTSEQFLKNLEFAHALAIFSKVTRPKYMTVYRFNLWLSKNGSNYQNLLNFLTERGY